ncbi:serine/threonine protein kinase [Methanoplanus sp. FWC-SCC4]|uniref:Serine/threonine protein kinase n=1 Tax=Methanochimaera problematica TaxID=2609417 RepID=A0AA97I326_9EURY|nr:serine/threonine-protein kinase [Methanoplanus sp. FWC-SCC4]WOF16228.1 serine/threonine protein kinase [Methanoplanus sp. FWC-SCC4]
MTILALAVIPVSAEESVDNYGFSVKMDNNSLNITSSDDDYQKYMQNFSSNILLLVILCLSGVFLYAINALGNKYSSRFRYKERFSLRVFLIPVYSIMGILLLISSLFSIASVGTVSDTTENSIMFMYSLMLFLYAITSIWMAYSIVKKKPYIFILIFEIAIPVLIQILFIGDGYKDSLELASDAGITFILLMIPVIHTRMLELKPEYKLKNKKISDEDKNKTLTIDKNEAAILMQTKKSNYLPAELTERYMDARYIKRGGTARVFFAKTRDTGKTVAVKIPISFDERTGRSFLKEMNIWEELSHENIVRVFSVNILPVPYVEMEYFKNSLADVSKPVEPDFALKIIKGIAEGLSYAHNAGIIHRDIKPQNILLSDENIPKITDWGLGKILGDSAETRTLAFSLNYAAPEQVAPKTFGRSDNRTDIFQLGILFYELMTGSLPFSGEGIGEFSNAIINDNPKKPSQINPEAKKFDRIILKCLHKNPDERYQTINDLIRDLDKLK